MAEHKRVLLIVYNAAHFRELFRLAKLLLNSGRFMPLVLFCSPYPNQYEHYQECSAWGIQAWIRGQPLSPHSRSWFVPLLLLPSLFWRGMRLLARGLLPRPLRPLFAAGKGRVRRFLTYVHAELETYLAMLRVKISSKLRSSELVGVHLLRAYKQLRYARLMCRTLRPHLLVLAEDNVEYVSGAWVRAAHGSEIPVLIVPYCLAGLEEPAAVYVNDPRHQADNPKNRGLARAYPHWVYEYQGRTLVRMPANQALPLEWLGISSPLPWLMNGTYADRIAVESPFMRDFYQRQGVPPSQIAVTGTANDDAMYEALQHRESYLRQLYTQYGMPFDRPMILCALPPVTSAMAGLKEEFRSYQDMLRFWLACLSEIEGYNIFISLHPTMN
ncbi:MAG: hypothetical protein RMJ19_07405, partial [Gemmatales bacterium]|nr:hypothetical protein [Gemmatales bacterium]MDW8175482.1 hypothetical protein [Gemmatales bacterium]